MPKVTVPGLKASSGLTEYQPLTMGRYRLRFKNVQVKPPKNPAPLDVWHFEFEVLSGPPQPNGKKPKSWKYWLTIKQENHPEYKPDQYAVDELKTMVVAAGVALKGDSLDPESFAGLEIEADIGQEADRNDQEKMRNKVYAWFQAS